MVMSPLKCSLFDTHTHTHTNVQVLAVADTVSGTGVVSFWLDFGTTVSLIRVERDHMACWLVETGREAVLVLERPTNTVS